jgi:carboxyl-terminal processing protease
MLTGCVTGYRLRKSPAQQAAILLLCLGIPVGGSAQAPQNGAVELGSIHARTARLVAEIVTSRHYLSSRLNDEAGGRILQHYLDTLDPGRLIFLPDDLAGFHRYASIMDDAVRDGALAPVTVIAARRRERVDQWVAWILGVLAQGPVLQGVPDGTAPPAGASDAITRRWWSRLREELAQLRSAGLDEPRTREVLAERYRQFRYRVHTEEADAVFRAFINAYLAGLDPHSGFHLPRSGRRASEAASLLQGVGIELKRDREYPSVKRIFAGGAAERSGRLAIGDRIVAVGEGDNGPMQDVLHRPIVDVVRAIRGPAGSTVRLRILPHLMAHPVTATLVRDRIRLEQTRARESVIRLTSTTPALRIGIISVPRFYVDYAARGRGAADTLSTSGDVQSLIYRLRQDGIDGLILDLRGNRGGALVEAVRTTGLLIQRGPVVQVTVRDAEPTIHRDTDPGVAYSGPLAVLIDRRSASASEIVAATIQDYGRGLVIGEVSYGKGTVQQTVNLNSFRRTPQATFGQLTITVAQYFRVSGTSIQLTGVVPDIALPVNLGLAPFTERLEPNALPPRSITGAAFKVVGNAPDIPRLKAIHAQRVAQNPRWRHALQPSGRADPRRRETMAGDHRWKTEILREAAAILGDVITRPSRPTDATARVP